MTSSNPAFMRIYQLFLVVLFTLFTLQAQAATYAAKVLFSSGGASKTSASLSQPLNKGDELFAGDTVHTGQSGRVQMRFTDGGLVSLMPGSSFSIDQYSQPSNADGGSIKMNLVKGGLRSITGSIGKDRPENYELTTEVATLGIRGTEFVVVLEGDSMRVGVSEGMVHLSNDMGELMVPAGSNAIVFPQQAPQPSDTPPVFVSGTAPDSQEEGNSGLLADNAASPLNNLASEENIAQNFPQEVTERPVAMFAYAILDNGITSSSYTAEELASMGITSYAQAQSHFLTPPTGTPNLVQSGGITWEEYGSTVYLTAPGATNLPMHGTLSYALSYKDYDSLLTKLDLSIHLGNSTKFDVDMTYSSTVPINIAANGINGDFKHSSFSFEFDSSCGTGSTCHTQMDGILTGKGGSSAGVVYKVEDMSGSGHGTSGAAILTKK